MTTTDQSAEIKWLREALAAQREWHANDIHSCHPGCARAGCVNERLRRELMREHEDHKQTLADTAALLDGAKKEAKP